MDALVQWGRMADWDLSMRIAVFAAIVSVMSCSVALAEQVTLTAPVTNFAAGALGGIRTVVRYAVARPDRSEVDYLLLGEASGEGAGAAPEAIQVEGVHGDPAVLADVDGADCVLARAAIVRVGKGAVVISVVRADNTKQVLGGSLSGPGAMAVRVYRSRPGGEAGESAPVFTEAAGAGRTKPVCSAAEVGRVVGDAVAAVLQSGGGR